VIANTITVHYPANNFYIFLSSSHIYSKVLPWELKANIMGPTDLYVKSGSDINLTCKILQGPHELGNIFWYKDGLTSRLKIRRALSSDTGNYTCVPTIAKSSSVYAHVIIGEHPAAMQHNSSSMHKSNFYYSICCMLLITILTCCLQHFCNDATITATGQSSSTLLLTTTETITQRTAVGRVKNSVQHRQNNKSNSKALPLAISTSCEVVSN
uniref:Ig-like domain-containing protein n=1 Tax=Glossina palpalis gambiensis TaxID=67801 RepID=A0A1B0BKP6_9MUSC